MKQKGDSNITVKQHFVPQFYIRNFYNSKNKVDCWIVGKKDNPICEKSAKAICWELNLYEWDMDEFLNDIEDRLDAFENEVKPAIDNIFNYFNQFELKQGDCLYLPKTEDIEKLIVYVIIQILRTPNMIHSLSDMVEKMIRADEMFCKLVFEDNIVKNSDSETIKAALKGKGLDFFFKNKYVLSYIYQSVKKTHKIVVFKSENLHFLSSDEPVVIDFRENKLTEENAPLLLEKSNFYFALSPKYCLGLLLSNKDYEDIGEDEFALRTINYRIYEYITELLVMRSNKYIYSDKIDEKSEKIIKRTLELKEKFKKDLEMK